MVHYDEKPNPGVPGGRLYTYVITLQGEWRFTETSPEFKLDFLSKHSMHSDIALEVAFAGEFFVRRRRGPGGMKMSNPEKVSKHPKEDEKENEITEFNDSFEAGVEEPKKEGQKDDDESSDATKADNDHLDSSEKADSSKQEQQPSFTVSNKASHTQGRPRDPENYVLIIDNDSGTYRPDSKTLPMLQQYLERNLPGLKVVAMACNDKRLKKWKKEQKPTKEVKKAAKFSQKSDSSVSSSEEEAVELSA